MNETPAHTGALNEAETGGPITLNAPERSAEAPGSPTDPDPSTGPPAATTATTATTVVPAVDTAVTAVPRAVTSPEGAAARLGAQTARFEDLKEHVHQELLQQLGPQLYDADLDVKELEARLGGFLIYPYSRLLYCL